jgi:molybdopterin molybdotransferase
MGKRTSLEVIPFERAYDIVLSNVPSPSTERVGLLSSLDRILAHDVVSDADVPGFDKSMMDGYALRRKDIRNELLVIESIQAGLEPNLAVGPNQCSKIMTGAKVPAGADTVVMVENTERTGANTIRVTSESSRSNIAKRGEDVQAGDIVLRKGEMITPAHVAVLALAGSTEPLTCVPPSIGIISTGSEIVEPGDATRSAGTRNTNAYQLMAQVKRIGIDSEYFGIAKDTEPETRRLIEASLSKCDITIVSGGVSMGDFDLVPDVMRSLGVSILFDRIAIKPGKPATFGRRGDKVVFALPGNPVSVFVIFEILVKPFIYARMGYSYRPRLLHMELGKDIVRMKTDRDEFVPVRFEGTAYAIPIEYHGSAHIHALTGADGLLRIEAGVEGLAKGTAIDVRQI